MRALVRVAPGASCAPLVVRVAVLRDLLQLLGRLVERVGRFVGVVQAPEDVGDRGEARLGEVGAGLLGRGAGLGGRGGSLCLGERGVGLVGEPLQLRPAVGELRVRRAEVTSAYKLSRILS